MIISNNICTNCGKCVVECPQAAISFDSKEKCHSINQEKCNDCQEYFDIECIRVCTAEAIRTKDNQVLEFSKIRRIRSGHLIWLVAVLGARGSSDFPLPEQEMLPFRQLISAAYLNSDLEVRLSEYFDDNCIGCARKQDVAHIERQKWLDDICYKQLGIKAGDIIKFWDLIQLVKVKMSVEFLRSINYIPEEIIEYYDKFTSYK